jgi:3-dehydroquinate synthase
LIPSRTYGIISDLTVSKLYSQKIIQNLQEKGISAFSFTFPPGEINKNLETFSSLQEQISGKLSRSDCIIAIGGGVTGDLAGFVASTYMRGISFIQIPTSLLAMVDSSVGGKLGVNTHIGKNFVGVFNHPEIVLIDPNVLKTLSWEDFHAGMGEIIKTAFLSGDGFCTLLEQNKRAFFAKKAEICAEIIHKTVEYKIKIVEQDEYDHAIRQILNLGHTFAHALEILTDYKTISHGMAVSLGLSFVIQLSEQLGLLSADSSLRAKNLLNLYEMPNHLSQLQIHLPPEKFLQQMKYDKKNRSSKIIIVLLEDLGKPVIHDNITEEQILEALAHVL